MLPLSTSKSYHHGDLRAALLDATLAVVDDVGIEGLSLREVSRRAGVSHTAAYNHFADKGALVRAFVEAAFTEFGAALRAARDAGTDPIDALLRIGNAYVRFAFEHRAQFKIMFRPELAGLGEPVGGSVGEDSYLVLVEGIETALRAGVIRGDGEVLVRASWSMVHGLAALIVDGPSESIAVAARDLEAMTTRTLLVLVEGMYAPRDRTLGP